MDSPSIRFSNGITVKGSYRYEHKHNGTYIEIYVVGPHEYGILGRRSLVFRRPLNGPAPDGFRLMLEGIRDMAQELLACNISKFKGPEGMAVAEQLVAAINKLRDHKTFVA